MNPRTTIETIAPALRGLLAQGPSLARVRFEALSGAAPAGALAVTLPEAATDPKSTVEALRKAMDGFPAKAGTTNVVAVAGVGQFHVEAPATTTGRAAGKVAVVTGGAQGFGLEIAQGLANEGACVVLADVNAAGAAAAAEAICARLGAGRAIGLAMNVTSGESIAEGLHQVVRTYGGLDLFVSNAGVLKAESVKTQPEKDFDFVTSVNYKGYYLCVQHVAPILAVQHLAKADYWSDIVQINSKSGLQGSNRNFAYAGSKFGGIGLTQSFAMELVEDRIKVNSICPGNFFEGPLWSDPKNGLFAQYLRTGKVPGAKTLDDVRHAYESKVPMGRGCRAQDVMRAIFYLMEQEYETGQALPVTGGQVMLA